MTEVDLAVRSVPPTEAAGLTARPQLTLAEEHLLLLWQVTASAESLLIKDRMSLVQVRAVCGHRPSEVLAAARSRSGRASWS
jgi:hypothetical protein